MKPITIAAIIGVLAALIIALNAFFVVDQREQTLVLEVGRAVDVHNEPGTNEAGLKTKIPFIQSTISFDKRNLGLDIPDIEAFASNEEQLIVDAFVRWRISDPLAFYQRFGDEQNGRGQLTRFTSSAIREALARRLPEDIISGARSELMDEIRDRLRTNIAGRGIDIIDVRIRRADLPMDVSAQVFRRMEAARFQEAERIRAEGDERAALVRATAERDRVVILADARRDAEIIRGEGDARRNEIYAEAYERDRDFFRFYRALEACERAYTDGTRIVVSPDNMGLCDEFIRRARDSSSSPNR